MNGQTPEKYLTRRSHAAAVIAACAFVLGGAALAGCGALYGKASSPPAAPGAPGALTISFRLKKAAGVVPSYQTAIWLQGPAGEYITSLFVSDYLAYGGFSHPTICSDWVKASDWENVSDAEFDAVTGPTPRLGAHALEIDCAQRGIAAGCYRYCVQTHIVEAYNILYSGEIEVGGEANGSGGRVSYLPRKHAAAGDVLCHVEAEYRP